ncbi:MAG: hypothetical protein ACXVDC_06250, partial [Bacteroidia bacterium]
MKRQFVMLFLLFTAFCFSQNFPYLNASTGNPNFFTDSDTNMYMIHGNRLAKMDKNFNPIWVNTYGSLSLKNILLSKTGSMYFIAAQTGSTANSIIGKMEASGNVSWMKSTSGMSLTVTGSSVSAGTLTCSNLFMSSDNNLLLSGPVTGPGNAALIKMDTLGNLIVARTFSLSLFVPSPSPQVSSVNILNEVSGVVNLVSLGNPGFGAGVSLEPFSYSIPGDSIVSSNQYNIGGCANCTADFAFNFFKSKTRSDVFYLFGHIEISSAQFGSPIPLHFALGKYNMTTRLWNQEYRWNVPPAPSMDRRLDEDEKGNIFGVYNVINGSQLGSTIYHSGFV